MLPVGHIVPGLYSRAKEKQENLDYASSYTQQRRLSGEVSIHGLCLTQFPFPAPLTPFPAGTSLSLMQKFYSLYAVLLDAFQFIIGSNLRFLSHTASYESPYRFVCAKIAVHFRRSTDSQARDLF